MEFKEMKKIWDQQQNKPLYVLNEEAVHEMVKGKQRKAQRLSNVNEWGLILINVLVAIKLLVEGYQEGHNIWEYTMAGFLLLIAAAIFVYRLKRQKKEKQFDRTMLGELDQAISNTHSLIGLGGSMVWWYVVPVGLMVFGRFMVSGTSWYYYLLILALFTLAALLVIWEVRRYHQPRRRKLMALRDKLLEETNQF